MEKVSLSEVLDLVAYEKVRDAMRARVIERKRRRRVAVGDHLTFLFENRDTVLFQIQEMVRTERIVHEDKIREELDAYNALIPAAGELSATLFIEIPELARMSQDEVRRTVNRFQGLDREGVVWLVAGDQRAPARFEAGHSTEEKMAAVHYLRFPLPAAAQTALRDPAQAVRLVVDHPNCRAETAIPPAVRDELVGDLR
jgi:hypothetical protein